MKNKEDRENEQLLATLGLTVITAQGVEYNMVSLFATAQLQRGGLTPDNIAKIRPLMDWRYGPRQTLGRLRHDAIKELNLDDSLTEQLAIGLKCRNFLIHEFYRKYAISAFSAKHRQAAMRKLVYIQSKLEAFQTALNKEVSRRTALASIAEDELQVAVDRVCMRPFGRILSRNHVTRAFKRVKLGVRLQKEV